MLDTHARKYVEPAINIGAKSLLRAGLTPNAVTTIAFGIGMSSSAFVVLKLPIIALTLLWLSGYLDAVDGAMARLSGKSSPMGALLDITFDRLVEIGLILSLGFICPDARLSLLFLSCSIIFSMSVFLTVGALCAKLKTSEKSFYYQAGLTERTEGFILFSAMILLPNHIVIISALFGGLVCITALQRMKEASGIF